MRKSPNTKTPDNLRTEYDLSKLKGGIRGKYYARATSETNLVLIEPELAQIFPNAEAVNHALRVLVEAAQAATHTQRSQSKRIKRAI